MPFPTQLHTTPHERSTAFPSCVTCQSPQTKRLSFASHPELSFSPEAPRDDPESSFPRRATKPCDNISDHNCPAPASSHPTQAQQRDVRSLSTLARSGWIQCRKDASATSTIRSLGHNLRLTVWQAPWTPAMPSVNILRAWHVRLSLLRPQAFANHGTSPTA